MEIGARITDFIRNEMLQNPDSVALTEQTPLLKDVVDSLGLLQLVAFLEESFGVELDDEDILIDNFNTVADIERLISDKLARLETT